MSSWQHHQNQGKQFFAQRDYETSLTHFQKSFRIALQQVPRKEQAILLSNVIACRLKIGGKENILKSVEEAKDCIKLDDKRSKAYLRLASAYIALGEIELDPKKSYSNDACQALQNAIRLDPSNSKARSMLVKELRRDEAPNYGVQNDRAHTESSSRNGYNDQATRHVDAGANVDAPYADNFEMNPEDDIDETWGTRSNSSPMKWVYEKINILTRWYDNLSDNGKTCTKIGLGLVILYICLGGRFGFEYLGAGNKNTKSNPYRQTQGSYGDGNAYDRFYQNQPSRSQDYNTARRTNEYDYGSSTGTHTNGGSRRYSYDYDYQDWMVIVLLLAFVLGSLGHLNIPLHIIPMGLGMRRGIRIGRMGLGNMNTNFGGRRFRRRW